MRWRGSLEAIIDDGRHYTFEIAPDLLGRNPNSFYTLRANPVVAAFVSVWIFARIMCQAIDLNGNRRRFAEEVEHERPEWMLPPELQALRTLPKYPPKPDLRRAHASAELARLVNLQSENPSTMLRMVPLPGKCRGG